MYSPVNADTYITRTREIVRKRVREQEHERAREREREKNEISTHVHVCVCPRVCVLMPGCEMEMSWCLGVQYVCVCACGDVRCS